MRRPIYHHVIVRQFMSFKAQAVDVAHRAGLRSLFQICPSEACDM